MISQILRTEKTEKNMLTKMEEMKNTKRIKVKTLQAMYVFTSFKRNSSCKAKSCVQR